MTTYPNPPYDSTSAPLTPYGVPVGEKILQPGERIAGFQVLQMIGSGGMAIVYKALQLSLNRPVALKILHSRFAKDPSFIQRFEQEAGALAALNHPNIVNVIDKGKVDDLYYFVMEFIQGTSLDKAIIEGNLTLTDFMIIITGIRDALSYVHSRSIVHRDIKPANILLSDEGRVKVSDFGIAHIAWGDPKLQKTGKTQFGTSHYMAPELVEMTGKVDGRADVFSLGVTFYKMFTKEIPQGAFTGPSQINPRVPQDIDAVIMKALQANPALRYQTVEEFSNDLLTVLWEASDLAKGTAPYGVSVPGMDTHRPTPLPVGSTPLPIPGQSLPVRPTSTFPSIPQPAAPPPKPRPSPAPQAPTTAPPALPEKKDAVPVSTKEKKQAKDAKPAKGKKPESAPAEGAGSKRTAVLLSILVILIVVGGGGYFAYTKWNQQSAPDLGGLSDRPSKPAEPKVVTAAPKPEVSAPPTGGNPFEGAVPSAETVSTAAGTAPPPPPTAPPSPVVSTGPVEQELVTIPAGAVWIGDIDSVWASPPHVVELPAFQIERYEVTNWMYSKFVEATGHKAPLYWVGGKYPAGADNVPVVEVSLSDALAYAKWAGRDIPTEAQWERAARGHLGWHYPWGQEWIAGATNLLTGKLLPVTAVGSRDVTLEATGPGCRFMAGNVMEWTTSRMEPYPGNRAKWPASGAKATVVRGGAFVVRTRDRVNPIFAARAGSRMFVHDPEMKFDNLGFRCVVNTP